MTDERIIAYLLEEMAEEESERFEDECFEQETWPEQLKVVEEELIEDYLRDELAPSQRQHFEKNYLTTSARQERVRMAAALLRRIDEYCSAATTADAAQPTAPTWVERLRAFWSVPSWSLPVAASLVVATLLAAAWWLNRTPAPPPSTLATITLSISSNTRAEGVQATRVRLPRTASALRIVLMLPERPSTATRYRVELEDVNGQSRPLETTEHDAQSVAVTITPDKIPRGTYALKLFAIDAAGTERRSNGGYYFTVE